MFLDVLGAFFVILWWFVLKFVVEPVESLMRTNGWRAELTLAVRLTFSTHSHGKMFDRAIPLRIRFPREEFPARTVEAHIEVLDVTKHV